MANDPAFLFYPGDWMGGTQWMTMEQKGCYMELLILQFNTGQFSETQAKQVLSICFDVAWPMLKQKFIFENGFYFNERLREEIEKRKKFTQSRRDNALNPKTKKNPVKKNKASAKHMQQHMEDENENKDRNIIYPFNSENFKNAWQIWRDYKFKEFKFKYKSIISEQEALNKVSRISQGIESVALDIIRESIANGWEGLFEPKESNNKSKKQFHGSDFEDN